MADIKLGFIGVRIDFDLVRGAWLGAFAGVITASSIPVDLTGSTIEAQLRKTPNNSAIAAEFHVDITDPVNGEFSYWLTDEQTILIKASNDPDSEENAYVWDLFWIDSLGTRVRVFYGDVTVYYGVTRE